jgi:hypothetical protein
MQQGLLPAAKEAAALTEVIIATFLILLSCVSDLVEPA